jgi:hypothetical protein
VTHDRENPPSPPRRPLRANVTNGLASSAPPRRARPVGHPLDRGFLSSDASRSGRPGSRPSSRPQPPRVKSQSKARKASEDTATVDMSNRVGSTPCKRPPTGLASPSQGSGPHPPAEGGDTSWKRPENARRRAPHAAGRRRPSRRARTTDQLLQNASSTGTVAFPRTMCVCPGSSRSVPFGSAAATAVCAFFMYRGLLAPTITKTGTVTPDR